jgi:hypothetical protein
MIPFSSHNRDVRPSCIQLVWAIMSAAGKFRFASSSESVWRGLMSPIPGARWRLILLLLAGSLVRATTLGGPGYSLDEEITYFAVQGIQRHGLPLFPSGLFNERGLPFSYAAWLVGAVFGQNLASYRLTSLFFAAMSLFAVYVAARFVVREGLALFACLLLTIFPPHIAVSGWARFYSLTSLVYVGSIVLFWLSDESPRLRPWFVACVALAALCHELCVTLVVLPILAESFTDADRGDSRRRLFVGCVATVAFARLAVIGLNFTESIPEPVGSPECGW